MLVIVKAFCTTPYTTVKIKAYINKNVMKIYHCKLYGRTLANVYTIIKTTYLFNKKAMAIEHFTASVNKTTLAGL